MLQLTTIILSLFLPLAFQQGASRQSEIIPTIGFCEVLRNPESYRGKLIRIQATWQWGFEWSFLYDRNCMERGNRAGIEILDEENLCPGSKKKLKRLPEKFNNKADVRLVGRLSPGANEYHFKFVVSCMEEAHTTNADAP
jgi:hypothetical protein